LLCSQLGNLGRVTSAGSVDLDHLTRDDFANGILAINQVQRFQAEKKSASVARRS
jgi:hypothetical protein